jgi:hypothetical protein
MSLSRTQPSTENLPGQDRPERLAHRP